MSWARTTIDLHSVAPDLIPQDAPADVWNAVRNIYFRNGEAVRALGDKPTLAPVSTDPKTLVYVEPSDQGYWVYAGDGGVFVADGANTFDITPAGGWSPGPGSVWSSCVINGLAVINCSTLDPVYWDGNTANPAEPLPDWPAGGRCLAMRAHKNFLFAIGMVSEGDQRVRWSDAAEAGEIPQSWAPAPDNLAGFVDLAPLSAACLEGSTLGDDFLIYKRHSVWALTFTGGNAVFTARKRFAQAGIAATNALTQGPRDEHLFVLGDGDVMITDGVSVASVLDGRAQRAFKDDFTNAPQGVFSAATLMREKLGFVIYPQAGESDGTQALVYDFSSGDIGFRDMPNVLCAAQGQELQDVGDQNEWDGDTQAWDQDATPWAFQVVGASIEDVLIGGMFGARVISNVEAVDFAGDPVSAFAEKSGIAFGNAARRKMIRRVWPKLAGQDGDLVRIRVGGQDVTGGSTDWADPVQFEIGADQAVDTFIQGRFLALEVSSDDGAPWRLGTVDVEFREVGQW